MTDKQADPGNPVKQISDNVILLVVASYAAAFVVFGFLVDDPRDVALGLIAITTSRDTLLTDYFGVGGIGAGCVNAGLLTLVRLFRLLQGGREDDRRGGRVPLPGARLRAVREEPPERLVHRDRGPAVFLVQG